MPNENNVHIQKLGPPVPHKKHGCTLDHFACPSESLLATKSLLPDALSSSDSALSTRRPSSDPSTGTSSSYRNTLAPCLLHCRQFICITVRKLSASHKGNRCAPRSNYAPWEGAMVSLERKVIRTEWVLENKNNTRTSDTHKAWAFQDSDSPTRLVLSCSQCLDRTKFRFPATGLPN